MFKKMSFGLLVLFGLLFSMFARAAGGPDFSGLTSQVDWSTAIAALLLVMGGLAGVYIVWTGGSLILSKIRSGR